MIAAAVLEKAIRELGCSSLCVPGRYLGRGLQGLAVDVLLGKVNVRRGQCKGRMVKEGGLPLIIPSRGGGDCEGDCAINEDGGGEIDVEAVRRAMPRFPLFVIDLAFWDKHSEVERRELVEQVISSIGYVREYLWDGNLAVSDAPDEFKAMFERYAPGMRHGVRVMEESPLQLIRGVKAAVLDPYGDPTDEDALRGVEAFIVGGIVDKERKVSNETLALYRSLGLDEAGLPRYKLTLWGSRVGVPDRINKVIKVVLDVVVGGKRLDDAVLAAQSNKDRLQRLVHELQKRGRIIEAEGERRLAIKEAELRDIISKLNVNEKVLRRATRGIKLVTEQ